MFKFQFERTVIESIIKFKIGNRAEKRENYAMKKDAMTSADFRKLAERMSKYFDLRGCETEKCINNRIKRKNSKKLNILVEHGFAFRLLLESWLNPHPVYKEILGMSDEEYNALIEEKRKADSEHDI